MVADGVVVAPLARAASYMHGNGMEMLGLPAPLGRTIEPFRPVVVEVVADDAAHRVWQQARAASASGGGERPAEAPPAGGKAAARKDLIHCPRATTTQRCIDLNARTRTLPTCGWLGAGECVCRYDVVERRVLVV